MERIIITPSGRRMSAGQFAPAWRMVKDAAPGCQLTGWQDYSVPAERVLADIRKGLNDRINRRGGITIPRDDDRLNVVGGTMQDLRIDRAEAMDYRERRIVRRGSGLRTALARKLYPDVQDALTDRDW